MPALRNPLTERVRGDLVRLGLVGAVGDAAGDVSVFVEVVAGADPVVAIGDL